MSGAPPLPKQLQSGRRQGSETVLMSLALTNAEQHAGRVDVVHAEPTDLAETNAGGIEDREHDPVAKRSDGGEKGHDLVNREHDREVTLSMTVGDALDQVGTIEDVQVEEAQRADALVVPAVRDLLHIADEEQVLLDVRTPEPVRGTSKVGGEPGDHVDVDVLSARGHVANAQGLAHPLAERGGGDDHERSPFGEIGSVDHRVDRGTAGGSGQASAGSLNHAKRAA